MPHTRPHKVRDQRLRRMAERQGLRLEKTKRKDPRAKDYGTFRLIDTDTDRVLIEGGDAARIETFLLGA